MLSLFFKGSFYCPELKKSFSRGRYTPQTNEELIALFEYAENREEFKKAYEEMLAKQSAESGKPDEAAADEEELQETAPIALVTEQAEQPVVPPVQQKIEPANKVSAAELKKQKQDKGK